MSAENNQSVDERPLASPSTKTGGGVFSWLTGSRSPTHGSAAAPNESMSTITTSVRSNGSGSPRGSVHSSGTASPRSGSRSPSRSPPRSPARRFVIPNLAMGGGGRFGPAVMMGVGSRSVYAPSDDDEEGEATEMTTTTTTTQEMALPPSMQIKTKTIVGEPSENQLHGHDGVHYFTTTSGDDNQLEPSLVNGATVRYVTQTGAAHGGHNQTIVSPAAAGVRYATQTVTAADGRHALASPAGSEVKSVRYITRTMGTPVASPSSVRYTTQTVSEGGLASPAGPRGSQVFFGPPQPAPHVHYVTRVINGQSVQVPVPAGVPSHDHRVHYVTAAAAGASPSSSSSTTTTTHVHGEPHQHQQVRYIVKSAASPVVVHQPQLGAYTATTTSATATTTTPSARGGVPLSAVVASTIASSPSTSMHGGHLNVETDDGLPPANFIGVQRIDTDSSDGEEHEVKMVFDIMSQTFKPVRRRGAATGAVASAGAGAGAGAVASAGAEAASEVSVDAGAVAAAGAAVELEEKQAAVAEEEDASGRGNGLAIGAAFGLAAAAAVGVAAAVSADKTMDTVAAAPPTVAAAGTPKRRRSSSQTKREPSPRSYFASAAASEEPRLPDHEIELDAEPLGDYAEVRSPTSHERDDSRLMHIGMLLKVRVCRWLLLTLVPVLIIIFLMILFYKGVALKTFRSDEYSNEEQYDMLDNYNGYVGLVASLFGTPLELLIALVVPILIFALMAKVLLGPKLSPRTLTIMFCFSWLLGYLISNGFHAINVQLRVKGVEPVIALTDLSLSISAAASLAATAAVNASSNASVTIAEGGVGNAITNTVLRNVVATSVDTDSDDTTTSSTSSRRRLADASSSLTCSNTADYSSVLGTSSALSTLVSLTAMSTTTVATYGFPLRSWQEEMLPGAMQETNYTIKLDTTTASTSVLSIDVLPMRVRTAANLFVQSAHIARDVFRWFDATSNPLNVQNAVKTKYGSAATAGVTYVPVVELLNLTGESTNVVSDALSTSSFVSSVRSLFNSSLAGAENISRSESTLEFTSVALPNGYAFDSVTMEIPLVKSFLSRRLKSSDGALVEDTAAANGSDVYYDLDIATDCGPYAGACEIRPTEYDADGNIYEPPTTVRAFALCNNSLGNDDLEVFFDGSVTGKPIAYTCDGKYDGGMLVISVSSRIVGDALIEGPSTLVPRLVTGMATLKNPRKIYSLTVGKLSWPTTNLALKFHAACASGVGSCSGLDYALTAALENATETLSALINGNLRGSAEKEVEQEESSEEQEYLVVGSEFLPLSLIRAFKYNATEATTKTQSSSVQGYPLVTITKPLEVESLFENDGDVVLSANFETVSWNKSVSGASCSATVEARLNSVLNNHYYMESGVQPAYTAGMYFLFQDAVTRAQIAFATSSGSSFTTLRFATTIEFLEMHTSIPLVNFILTLIACAVILVGSLLVAMRNARQQFTATEGGEGKLEYASPETFARVKLDRALFPAVVMERRLVDMSSSSSASTTTAATGSTSNKTASGRGRRNSTEDGEGIDAFAVGNMRLEHESREHSVDVPYAK